MRKKINIPRIIKIDKIEGFTIYCMFNNGEIRLVNFEQVFNEWKIKPSDLEYPLTKPDHIFCLRKFRIAVFPFYQVFLLIY